MNSALILPRRPRGKLGRVAEAAYQLQRAAFCEAIVEVRSRLDFDIGARGWCYILEEYGLDKGDFNAAESLISECRKTGELPLNIVAEDGARKFENLEDVDSLSPVEMAADIVAYVARAHEGYYPVSFWDFQTHYIEMLVEKIDLRNLFQSVCARYCVPIANARGSSDINSRAAMMRRFAINEAKGRKCVLLYAGDFDPAGLRISDFLHKNLADLSAAVGWDPSNLIVDRFGLNHKFIVKNRLTWIDNLETGSGGRLDDPRHPDHRKAYVQDYLAAYGARKVEANALVTRPQAGRRMCEKAILRYLDNGAGVEAFVDHTIRQREVVEAEVKRMLRDQIESS